MALTLPTQLSAFPPPVLPDFAQCQAWFAHDVVLNDCQVAFDNLPVNEDPIQYRPIRQDPADAKGLLVVKTHNQCQLRLHASGKWVEENVFAIDISPNKIRNMFGRLMGKCVQGQKKGGFVTNGINNTMKWLLREDTEFPGEPSRTPGEPRKLYIPESATFLTAMIWHTHGRGESMEFEPGANHPVASHFLYRALQRAAIDLEEEDPQSTFIWELQRRGEFLSEMIGSYQYIQQPPFWTWWGSKRIPYRPLSENGSLTLFNATGLSIPSITVDTQ